MYRTSHIHAFVRTNCIQAVMYIHQQMAAVIEAKKVALQQSDLATNDSLLAVDADIFLGRVARSIALYAPSLLNFLTQKEYQTSTKPEDWNQIEAVLLSLYSQSYDLWSDMLARGWQQCISSALNDDAYWRSMADIARSYTEAGNAFTGGTWEAATISMVNEKNESLPQQIHVPAHPSNWAVMGLMAVIQEVQRQGGYLLDRRRVLLPLASKCLHTTLDTFERHQQWNIFDYKSSLQLFLDFGFLWKIFRGAAHSKDEQVFRRFVGIRDQIKQQIDPIDFALFEPTLTANVDRSFRKFTVLLEPLIHMKDEEVSTGRDAMASSSASSSSSSTSSFLNEQHNLVPMCPLPARFPLLPISYAPPSSRKAIPSAAAAAVAAANLPSRPSTTKPLDRPASPMKSLRSFARESPSSSLQALSSSIQSKLGMFFKE